MKAKTTILIILLVILGILTFLVIETIGNQNPIKQQSIVQPVPADSVNKFWYKRSVIYSVDVEKFKDSDGDGIGDFNGLTQKLGYLDSLGIDVIWLAPFQPTPNLDDGYDVSDFYGIDKRLGTEADFTAFMLAAKAHNIRIIMDLVINHTSDSCFWFKQAQKSRTSPYHDWYVWSNERPKNWDIGMVFPGVQKEIWSYDTVAKQYFYHRFYKFQPDLNMQNKAVQQEVLYKVPRYWMEKGLWGFRMDAVPFAIEVPQHKGGGFPMQFELLNNLNKYMHTLRDGSIILGEANVEPKQNKDFYGEHGDRMNMMFNFFVNQRIFLALATSEVKELESALQQTQNIPLSSRWGQFLRNHDEVDLGRLTDEERQKVFDKMGPEHDMLLYHRGIRRRLAPMLNNIQELKMAYSLLFTLPSTPVIRYGEEIGMGDDLSASERNSIRTPMQWDSTKNAGFTTAAVPIQRIIDTGNYKYQLVNVAAEQQDSTSLLRFIQHTIQLYKSCPEISFGSWQMLQTGSPHVLAIQYSWQGKTLIAVHNFSSYKQKITICNKETLQDLYSHHLFTSVDEKVSIPLNGYEFVWLRE
jgi:maltose alpha-D-glucosyltransferase/alpha-amylase